MTTTLHPPDMSGGVLYGPGGIVGDLQARVAALEAELDEIRRACVARLDEEYLDPQSEIARQIVAHRYVRKHRGWALHTIWKVTHPDGELPRYRVPEDVIDRVRAVMRRLADLTAARTRQRHRTNVIRTSLRAEIARVDAEPAHSDAERQRRAGVAYGLRWALRLIETPPPRDAGQPEG